LGQTFFGTPKMMFSTQENVPPNKKGGIKTGVKFQKRKKGLKS